MSDYDEDVANLAANAIEDLNQLEIALRDARTAIKYEHGYTSDALSFDKTGQPFQPAD